MAAQNLVSASISPEKKQEILQKLADIKNILDFLVTLQSDEVQALFKAGKGYAPFVEKAYNVVISHPSIMPGVFDIEEFKRDYSAVKQNQYIVPGLNVASTEMGEFF